MPSISYPSIRIPCRRAEILTRQRLLDRLHNLLERKLILIIAPAGYGKTSLLIDFAHQKDISVGWYTIDRYDQNLRRFLAHLVASIARVYPEFGVNTNAVLENLDNVEGNIELLVEIVVNEIFECIDEHFVIVLDDFQVVRDNQAINTFLSRFISRVGENCHLVIVSRQQLNLPDLELFVARSQVGIIDVTELVFTPIEIQSLAQKHDYRLTDQQTAALVEQTEGWITGILLTPTICAPRKSDFLRGSRSNGASLAAYWDLLLDQQIPTIRKLLLCTSPLDEFNTELCQKLFQTKYPPTTDWDALLDTLLRNNLFVQPMSDDSTWLRYHNLFQEYLQARLEREYPGCTRKILLQLLDVYRESEDWERAYNLTLQFADLSTTMDVIEQAGPSMLKYGRFSMLTLWLENVPPDLLSSRPGLLSLKGGVALMGHNLPQGLELLNQAAALQSTGDPVGLARTLVRRSTGYQFMGNHTAALADAEEALRLAGQDDRLHGVKAQALKARGVSLHRLDRSAEGIRDIEHSLALYTALGDKPNIASLYHELGMIYFSTGDMAAARSAYAKAMDYWRSQKDFYRLCDLLNNLGVLYHQLGEYEQSIAAFDEGLKYARLTGFARLEAYILASLGELYADIQAVQDAEEVFEKSLIVARRIKNRYLCFYVACDLASLASQNGEVTRAHVLCDLAFQHFQNGASQEKGLLALTSARLRLAEGRFQDAIQVLNTAISHFHAGKLILEEIQAHLYLGAAYLNANDEENSKFHLQIVFDHLPTPIPYHAILAVSRYAIPALEHIKMDPRLGKEAIRLLEHFNQLNTRLPEIRRKLRRHVVEAPLIRPKIVIRGLGSMQVTVHGKTYNSLDWQSRTQRELFFYLLQHEEGATKEAIFSLFWGNTDEQGNRLATALYKMRRLLGEEVIVFMDGRYRFNRAMDYEYDVETFLHYWMLVKQDTDGIKRSQILHRMIDLYQGDYAVEAGGSWVVTERERLYQIYTQAVSNLVVHYLGQREYASGLECCLSAMERDNCQEAFYRLAMKISAAMGDLPGVKHYYLKCKQALDEAHGIHLSDETHHLYRHLMN